MPTPLHPVLVHLPIALAALAPFAGAVLVVAWRRHWLPARAGWLLVGLQAVLVIGALIALRSGEHDEELVESVVSERFLEAHEQAAVLFTWAAAAVLVLAVGAMLVRTDGLRRMFGALALAGSFVVLALGINVGRLGGELVYAHGAGAAFVGSGAQRAAAALDRESGTRAGNDD